MSNAFFNEAVAMLSAASIPSPRLEARVLLAYVCGKESDDFSPFTDLTAEQQKAAEALIARRIKHEPLDKILGYRDFYKFRFEVNRDVLSPRPDSETIAEAALDLVKKNAFSDVLELGVGSGCLLLSVIADSKNTHGTGADISEAALKTAQKNAVNLGIEQRVDFLHFDYFKDSFSKEFDIIISNPPYIPTEDIKTLDKEVRDFDPMGALDGGKDGYDHYRQIAKSARSWLKINGYIVLEVGMGQTETVVDIFEKNGWKYTETKPDLNGINRCVIMQK